jgi:hypothetical protein
VRFHACTIASEGLATDDEGDYLDGEVDLDIIVDGKTHPGLVARVKQAAGSRFADPLEILPPVPYAGPLHYGRFRECVERYVRERVARQGQERERNVRLHDLRLPAEATCDFVT